MEFGIQGVLAPVFTPMDHAGNINCNVIPEYMQHLVSNNIKGILVGGTTGEAASLNVVERKQLLSAWVQAARPHHVKIISQVGGAPLPDVIELATYSESVKADAVMTLPELYYKPRSVEQLVDYLQVVSTAAPNLPLVYYHFPTMSGVDLNMRDVFATAKIRIPNFKGMKADLSVAVRVGDQLDSDQQIFIANHHLAPAVLMGHHSSIATVTNIFPSLVHDIVTLVNAGEVRSARDKQNRMNRLVGTISSHGDFVPSMKAAMELLTGVKIGPPRQPLTPLKQSIVSRMADQLQRFDII